MRVNLNFNQPRNTIINAARVNASFAKYRTDDEKASNSRMRNDRVTLSPQGKLMSMIENLTQQKQALAERRNDLVESTLDSGGKMEDIKEQLKSYKKQIDAIDKQIAGAYAQQAKQCMEPEDRKDTAKANKNKTEDQLEAERLSSLAGISQDIKSAEKISAVKDHTEGEARIKESEVVTGNVHVDALESEGLHGSEVNDLIETESDAIARKEKEIEQLWNKASDLMTQQGEILKESREELEASSDADGTSEKTDGSYVSRPEAADNSAETAAAALEDKR